MRKIIGFFAGISMLALVLALVYTSVRIYNYAKGARIETVLLQPADLWQNRIDAPIPLANVPEGWLRNKLIVKFLSEYLGVTPNASELSVRETSRGTLYLLSSRDVMAKWSKEIKPELENMANEKKMRAVIVNEAAIKMMDEYFVIPFWTKTWEAANDLDAMPAISGRKEMYIRLRFNKRVRGSESGGDFDAGKVMDRGYPASAIFEFMVDEVEIR